MIYASMFTSNVSMIYLYAATNCSIYVSAGSLVHHTIFLLGAFSGKPWDMLKFQPFGCMYHYHIPKLMRTSLAALKPTSTAGICVGYSHTSHKYIVFLFSTGAIVERSQVHFNPNEFLDGLERNCVDR